MYLKMPRHLGLLLGNISFADKFELFEDCM